MNFKFETLCSVNFRHTYFGGEKFSGISAVPLAETSISMRKYGLVFRSFGDGFTIMFDSEFAGSPRSREMLLSEGITISFRLDLSDQSLYNYTASLPASINNSFFYFSNFSRSENGSFRQTQLHEDEFAGIKDMVDAGNYRDQYFSLPFGHLDLKLHPGLQSSMQIRFSARAAYWQYILISEHLKTLSAPAVLNKTSQKIFQGPEKVELPESRSGIGFISEEPITLSNQPNRQFQLVDNYDASINRYKVVMDILPNPDIHVVSMNFSSAKSNTEKNILTMIL